ncbi:MAG: EF-hand domain-containing protein [Thermoguttaceae bacterium]|jgi:Ca2+-binding EF-hand superfamily protein
MHRLILCSLTGLTIVFLPQYLLAEDPAGPPGPVNAQPAGPNPEISFNRLDTNHDGVITRDELPPGMPEMFKQLLFLADSNGDGKITRDELTAALNQHRPGPGSEPPPLGRRSRGPEGQTDQMPGPPFGRRFGGPEGRPDDMAGPPFGRQAVGPGWMGGQRFGGPDGRPDQMAGPPFRGPGAESPQKPAGADGPEGPVQVEAYSITKADPQTTLKVMQTLLAGKPDVRMDIDPKTNHLIVLARPAEHATIRAALDQLQRDTQGGADAKEKPAEMAGPPFGGPGGRGWMGGQGFGRPGNGPGWMGGPPFGRQGMGPGRMEGQRFGESEPGSDRMPGPPFVGPGGQRGWMGGPPFGGPGNGPDRMGGPPFDRGGPDGRPPQLAGPNFPGPNARSHWMGGSPFIEPGGRPWAGPGYGPPHRWAAFEPMQQRPWQQYGHWGPPNRPWQANFAGPDRPWMPRRMAPWMAYGAGSHRPWPPNGQNWYQQLLSYNARPPRQGLNLKALFGRLDANHDNQLSFDEFSQGVKHLLHAVLPGPGPQWARLAGRFGGQGFGPPARPAMANYPAPRFEITRQRITRLFQNFDKNHDGKLTKDETPPKIQKKFDRIDVEKNGFITPRDLYRAVSLLRHSAEDQKPVNQGYEKTPAKPEAKDKPE